MTARHPALAPHLQLPLGHWPTPLEPADRLREAIGGPRVWVKRDDCTGLAVGGNKTRKLEYLLGDARSQGAVGVVTFGALQSNHARQTAAACARAGLACDLILTRQVDRSDQHYLRSGNVLLDELLGATVHVVDDGDAAFTRFAELFDEASADGRTLYGIVPGGSDPVGTLGYVDGALELAGQLDQAGLDPERLVVAASTGGTAAGLVLGFALAERDLPVEVACVYEPAQLTSDVVRGLVAATASVLEVEPPADERWSITDATLGPGYGIPTDACLEAIELLARTEGLLLDPVYSGKAMALLLDRIRTGSIDPDADVVFLHTGGSPGLFAYTPAFADR